MAEDVEKAVKRADKRLHKIMRRYGITDAVKEIGEAMQELDDLEGVKLANAAVTADLPSGDVALAVFSLVKKEDLDDKDEPDADGGEEWATVPESFRRPGDASWEKHAEDIDRFRDKVSAYYGFKAELIMPVSISDTSDPLLESTFTVLGVEYEVSDAVLTPKGEQR